MNWENCQDCNHRVSENDPYFATPCGTFCSDCMSKHVEKCGICAGEFEELESEVESVISAIDFEGHEIPFNLHDKIRRLISERDDYKKALVSIASNTCCEKCQEAALVAQSAIKWQDQ